MKKLFSLLFFCFVLMGAVACASREETDFCTVTYMNGETVFYTEQVAVGEVIDLWKKTFEKGPPIKLVDKQSYEFSGWGYRENGAPQMSVQVVQDVTFYALFTEKDVGSGQDAEYTVTFIAVTDKGEEIISTQKVKLGEKAVPPGELPTRTGYTFSRWDRDPAETPVTGRTEFKATYEKNHYTLYEHVLGKVTEETIEYEMPLELTAPTLPNAFSFEGWFTGEAFSTPAEYAYMPASDMHIYAKCAVNFGQAHLSAPANPVYGSENIVHITGLPQSEGLSYTFEWSGGKTGETYALTSAGEQEISVKVVAHYTDGEYFFKDETTLNKTISVAKKSIEGTLTIASTIEYGTLPNPSLEIDGIIESDELDLQPAYEYRDEEGELAQVPLSAGRYMVTASLAAFDNYELSEITPVSFEVTKKQLTISAAAEDIVYGESPAPILTYAGFIEGEDETVLTQDGAFYCYQREGDYFTGERFPAGEYELSVYAEAFKAQNYAIYAAPATYFTIERAPLAITVTPDKTELVYGEQPNVSISHSGFAYPDETESEIFGSPIEAVYSDADETFFVGSYTVTANHTQDTENYAVTVNSAIFTVSPKEVKISLAPMTVTFGDIIELPTPTVEGLISGEESLKKEIFDTMRYVFRGNGADHVRDRFLDVGSYAVIITIEREDFPNYEFTCMDGTLTIGKRNFSVNSGEVSHNRNREWTFTPSFSGADAALFEAEGVLVLNTRDAGTYISTNAGTLAESHFGWRTPLKITLKDGREVTDNFEVTYALHVTLNNSHFNVTVPATGLTFTYDGTEHEFAVQITLEESETEQVIPTVKYKVNGSPAEKPLVKNSGAYEIECEIVAENYETETRKYTVTVNKANYTLSGTKTDIAERYDGSSHGEELTLRGVNGENVESYLSISTRYTPFVGESINTVGWRDPVNAGTYEISYTAEGNPNYEDVEGSFVVTINRIEYSVEIADQTYTYSPNKTFGSGVQVAALAGNQYAVSYTYRDKTGTQIPTFSEAIPEGVRVEYTISEGDNYEEKTGSYTVTILKAQGELNVDGIRKQYAYNGLEQRVESGATSNNREDGVISYENNTFTTVAEGNALVVIVRLAEGKNYTGDSKTVTDFIVEKQTYISLPVEMPNLSEQYNKIGKTLSDVPLPASFRWVSEDEPLSLGSHRYDAIYNPDSENCNDFPLTVTFITRKERLSVVIIGGETDFGTSGYQLASYSLAGEDSVTIEEGEERNYITLQADGKIDEKTGGTYPIDCTLTAKENNYFELTGETRAVVPFKLKSVEADGKLYTIEDVLHLLEQGRATVKHNTAFMSEEVREKFEKDPYDGESYYTLKRGVTLLVPYKDNDTGSTAQNRKQAQTAVSGSGYVTLTFAEEKELFVEGTLIVNALRSSDGARTSMVVGENYGNLKLEKGAKVRVRRGGVFESMGFTYGEGEVIAESGSQIYEPFAMAGWKGGSISAAIRNNVFPFNQYALSSLVVKTHFLAGANYTLRASVSATLSISGEQNIDLAVAFLGSDSSAFLELSEGEIAKHVNEASGKICFEAMGTVSFHNLEMKLSSSIKFDTSGLQVPLPGNVQITLAKGCIASVPDKVALKLLPGARVAIEQGAKLTVENGGAIYGYGGGNTEYNNGLSVWQDGGNGLAYPHSALSGAYRKPVTGFGYNAQSSAELKNDGTLTIEGGGTLAAEITGSGSIELNERAKLSGTVKEDKTPAITGTMDKLKALSGQGGVYFDVTLRAVRDGQDLMADSGE